MCFVIKISIMCLFSVQVRPHRADPLPRPEPAHLIKKKKGNWSEIQSFYLRKDLLTWFHVQMRIWFDLLKPDLLICLSHVVVHTL